MEELHVGEPPDDADGGGGVHGRGPGFHPQVQQG